MSRHRTGFVGFVQHIPLPVWIIGALFALIICSLAAGAWYGYTRLVALERHLATLDSNLASTTQLLQANISETHTTLASALEEEREKAAALESQLGNFQQEVGTISGSVSNLQKLQELDSELLQKYSKVFFLNEHYTPEDVVEIPNEYKYYEQRYYTIHTYAYPYLKNMLNAAKTAGAELYVYSAYRSFDEQEALKGQYTVTYGAGTANQFSADQGYSEHQLGTTVDLITTGIGGTLNGFADTNAYQWLRNNAHRYGFILSYPEKNAHYVFEPWHWRFVGVNLATNLHNTNRSFYDLEQREIDSYLPSIFD